MVFDGAAECRETEEESTKPFPSLYPISSAKLQLFFSFIFFTFFNYNYCPFYIFLDIFRLSVPLGFGLDLLFFFVCSKTRRLHMWHSLFYFKTKAATSQSFPIRFFFSFSIFKSPSKRNPILELFLFYGRLQDLFFHDSFDAGALICEVNIKIIYKV